MMRTVKPDKIRVCFNREDFRVIIWGNLLEFGDLGFLVFNNFSIIFSSSGGGRPAASRSNVTMCS